jgi:hypothetical protein
MALVIPASPSVTATLWIRSFGRRSSFVMVPTPWLSTITALGEFERLTKKCSSCSLSLSLFSVTVIDRVVVPGANVSVVGGFAT